MLKTLLLWTAVGVAGAAQAAPNLARHADLDLATARQLADATLKHCSGALSVLDRGNGIDPAELDSIFNPFIRGDRARGGRGTGLGLAIVRRIAALHGGSVELRNRSGGGLEARVRLPLGLLLPRDAV